MATEGTFDSELKPLSWFDDGLYDEGWFSADLIEYPSAPSSFVAAWVVRTIELRGMKKNAAGQRVGVQMRSATDGSAFTGAVTVSVTVDAGTQATGSVGSGACTHEGNGYHTYAPAQAETNGDLLAFTFTGSGAIPETVQVYTSFPQTVDLSTGITAGTITTVTNLTNAPSAGDFTATMKTSIGTAVAASAVASVTGNVGGNVSGSVGSVVGAVGSVTGLTASDVGAIKAKTDSLTFTKALELDTNIQSVNGVTVNGDGAGTPMGV